MSGSSTTETGALCVLILEHFEYTRRAVDDARWGDWFLDQAHASSGQLRLTHARAGHTLVIDDPGRGYAGDWVTRVSSADWATADDIVQLVSAVRDLAYARWLGVLPEVEPADCAGSAVGAPGPGGR